MSHKATEHHSQFRPKKSTLLQIAILAIAVIVLVPQIDQFASSWQYLSEVDLIWVAGGLIGLVLTALFAALVYIALVPLQLPLRRTILIQSATYFTNRLLPSGLGGIGLNTLYISKQTKLPRSDGAIYATANNLIGFCAFWLCSFGAALFADSKITMPDLSSEILFALGGLCLIAAIVFLGFPRVQQRIVDFAGHLWGVIITMLRHPKRIILALLASCGITVSYVFILWCAAKGVGASVGVTDMFIAFMAGNAALTFSPTPGGIGAVEAAMVAVLVGAGNDPSLALASIVTFRLISYWLPVLPGYIFFRYATKKNYV